MNNLADFLERNGYIIVTKIVNIVEYGEVNLDELWLMNEPGELAINTWENDMDNSRTYYAISYSDCGLPIKEWVVKDDLMEQILFVLNKDFKSGTISEKYEDHTHV